MGSFSTASDNASMSFAVGSKNLCKYGRASCWYRGSSATHVVSEAMFPKPERSQFSCETKLEKNPNGVRKSKGSSVENPNSFAADF